MTGEEEKSVANNKNNKKSKVGSIVIVILLVLIVGYVVVEKLASYKKSGIFENEKVSVNNEGGKLEEGETKPSTVLNPKEYSNIPTHAYDIEISKEGIKPQEVFVQKGVNLIFTLKAIDGDYDLVFPDFDTVLEAKKGDVSPKSLMFFSGESGSEYKFYCQKCPAGIKNTGRVVVK